MRRLLVVFWLAMISGCALLPSAPTTIAPPAQLEAASFALNGRILINQHGERHSAGLHWLHRVPSATHQAQSDEILLLTPLGQTVARIYRDDKNAILDNGDKHYQDVDAEALMQQVLGWHLPLAGLQRWILGLPADYTPAQIERDSDGRISVLHQDGWEVRYLHYANTSPDSLPTRMQLNHEDLQVQLLIDEWEWNPQ
jgi:outer membrane lipoprotein LolB